MASMTYCMFENTLEELLQIKEEFEQGNIEKTELSSYELKSAKEMLSIIGGLEEDIKLMLEE